MSLIGNIDNIPLFTTIAEAELWGSQYGISGYHTHTLLGQLGYMAGFSHLDILAANLNLVSNPITPSQVYAARSQTPRSTSAASSSSSSSSSSSGGGGGY